MGAHPSDPKCQFWSDFDPTTQSECSSFQLVVVSHPNPPHENNGYKKAWKDGTLKKRDWQCFPTKCPCCASDLLSNSTHLVHSFMMAVPKWTGLTWAHSAMHPSVPGCTNLSLNPGAVMLHPSEPKSEKSNARYSKKCPFHQKQSRVNPGTVFSMTFQTIDSHWPSPQSYDAHDTWLC